jgi:ATP/maltotriose-dependent transcriptional regulator MalT
LVETLAPHQPVAILLDDLQWADPDTIELVRSLRRQLRDLPVAIVLAMRPSPRPPELGSLLDELQSEGITALRLGPMDDADIAELTGATLGAAPGERLLRELGRAGGNPFYALELLQAFRAEGRLRLEQGRTELAETAIPEALRHTMLRRLATLPAATAELLRQATILGSSFVLDDLSAVADARVGPEALVDAVAAGLVTPIDGEAGSRFAFCHDLLRTSLHEELEPDRRGELHRRHARRLAERGAPAADIAPHVLLAEPGDGDDLIDLIRSTAAGLVRTSAAAALQLSRFALGLLAQADPRRYEVEADTLEPMLWQGELAECEALARRILPHLEEREQIRETRWNLYLAAMRQNGLTRAIADLERSLAGPDIDALDRSWMQASIAHARIQLGDVDTAAALAADALSIGAAVGDTRPIIGAELALGLVASCRGEVAAAVAHTETAALLQRAGDPRINADLYFGIMLIEADEFDTAEAELRDGRRREHDRGERSVLPAFDWGMAGRHYLAGAWDDALAVAESGFDQVAAGTGSPQASVLGRALCARILLQRGDDAAAESHLDAGDIELARGDVGGADVHLWARARLLEHRGDPEGALNVLRAQFTLTASMRYFLSWRSAFPDIVRLALLLDEPALAAEVAQAADEGARRARELASARGCALWCRGLVDGDPDTLVRAAAGYRRSPRLPDFALCASSAAEALVAAGRGPEAIPLYEEASAIFESLGALADAAPVSAALGRLTTGGRPEGAVRPTSGWDSLTPSEERIVALVAEGLTTPQIANRLNVSRDTVKTHLRHVFWKLGMTSRVTLATAAAIRQSETARPQP